MNSWRGARAGWAGLSFRTLTPRGNGVAYGTFAARMSRYALARAYRDNYVYDGFEPYAVILKNDERLYKFIRGIENPVPLENSLYVAYTYPGAINPANLKSGALPLAFDNDALEAPLAQIIKWSNLDQQLGSYVSNTALLGDAFWWVVSDPARQRCRLELLEAEKVKYVERDSVGNIKAAVIEYEYAEQSDVARYQPGQDSMTLRDTEIHLKTVIVDQDSFSTYRDGKPWAFVEDAEGNPLPAWDNPYRFVPMTHAVFAEGADGWGRNSFFGVARRQIDDLNDQASIINDSIRIAIAPTLQAKGITAENQIDVIREDRDSMAIIYLSNPEASLEAVNVALDIEGASANRDRLKESLEANMPVLSLLRVRDYAGTMSGTAIETLFGDGVNVVKQLRKNVDPPLAAALQMGVTMAAVDGYDGFQAFTVDSYDSGDMDLRISERPVIDDTVSKQERLTSLPQVAAQPPAVQRLMLEAMGYAKDVIDDVVKADQAASPQQPVNATNLAALADIHRRAGLTDLLPKSGPQPQAKPEPVPQS